MLRLIKYVLFLPAIILISCGEEKTTEAIPPNVLSHEKMVKTLIDIHLTEAAISINVMRDSSVVTVDSLKYNDLFLKNNITKSQYDSSRQFYGTHPKLLDSIYTDVLSELSKLHAKEANN